jgi:hypothetical protein
MQLHYGVMLISYLGNTDLLCLGQWLLHCLFASTLFAIECEMKQRRMLGDCMDMCHGMRLNSYLFLFQRSSYI